MSPDDMENWRAKAACRNADPYVWHPEGESIAAFAPARAICDQCPAKALCLAYALRREAKLTAQSRYGMWGGKTPRERARLAGVLA